jgi:hypothetical protein
MKGSAAESAGVITLPWETSFPPGNEILSSTEGVGGSVRFAEESIALEPEESTAERAGRNKMNEEPTLR